MLFIRRLRTPACPSARRTPCGPRCVLYCPALDGEMSLRSIRLSASRRTAARLFFTTGRKRAVGDSSGDRQRPVYLRGDFIRTVRKTSGTYILIFPTPTEVRKKQLSSVRKYFAFRNNRYEQRTLQCWPHDSTKVIRRKTRGSANA